jgi:hypothetical protein
MFTIFRTAIAAGLTCVGLNAQAATVSYDVTGTVHEAGFTFGLWIDDGLDGLADVIYEITETGSLVIEDDGTAKFKAKSRLESDSTTGFDLDFDLDMDFLQAPSFKSVFDAVEHGNEFYLDIEKGLLTGVGDNAGLDLGVTRFPVDGEFVFQIGGGITDEVGANQHTSDFGMSGWFQITSVLSATCADCAAIDADNSIILGASADVNVDLNVPSVPLPAGGLLLLSALGATFGVRRFKRA